MKITYTSHILPVVIFVQVHIHFDYNFFFSELENYNKI